LILIVSGAVILAGNTFYPIFLRAGIWLLSLIVPKHTEMHHSLAFLLQHPRRCYLLLFPKRTTWYLVGVQVVVFVLLWICFTVLNVAYSPVISSIGYGGQYVFDGLFQALGVRSSGFYIITISSIAPAVQVFYMVAMYISAIPFIISLRSSNVYEDRSIGTEDDEKNGSDNEDNEGSTVQKYLQNQLAYDLWWITLAVFLIAIVERARLATAQPGFSLWSIIFEVVSAYGTVGLSLGVPYDNYSFCGAWHVLSKLILITVMLRGRHRILPLAIDRAVLLPGQNLMEKMDQQFRRGHVSKGQWRREENRIRAREEGSQAERQHGGQNDEADNSP
jgi:potassium uptake Trk family protein